MKDFLLRHLSKVTLALLERRMARRMVRIPVADAVSELAGMRADSPVWLVVREGMIDQLQRGCVEPYRSPEGELRFKLTAKGKALCRNPA